jgi:hypothetical protein
MRIRLFRVFRAEIKAKLHFTSTKLQVVSANKIRGEEIKGKGENAQDKETRPQLARVNADFLPDVLVAPFQEIFVCHLARRHNTTSISLFPLR